MAGTAAAAMAGYGWHEWSDFGQQFKKECLKDMSGNPKCLLCLARRQTWTYWKDATEAMDKVIDKIRKGKKAWSIETYEDCSEEQFVRQVCDWLYTDKPLRRKWQWLGCSTWTRRR